MNNFSLLLLFLLTSYISLANTYYVATNGEDTNVGTLESPWLTIQKAAETAIAGDTTYIRGGNYSERVTIENSGTENDYIIFSNYQNELVEINGTGIIWWEWNGLFDVSNKSYIKVIGLKVINSTFGGFWAEDAHHITFEDNYTNDTFSSGIGIWNCSYILVNNNEIIFACHAGGQESITLSNTYYSEVKNNNIHDNGNGEEGGEGIDIKQGSHDITVHHNHVHHLNNRVGIYVDAWDELTYNIEVYNNTINNNTESGIAVASEFGGLVEYVYIYNNIIYNNKFDGIQIGNWVHAEFQGNYHPVKRVNIVNNTCYNNGSIDDGYGYGITIDNDFVEEIIVRNNICSENNNQIEVIQPEGVTVDHNLIFGENENGFSTNGLIFINADPLFVDKFSFNFHLQNTSPAIDQGNSQNAPLFDFDNFSRPTGVSTDIGAFEYGATNNIDVFSAKNDIYIFPIPATNQLWIDLQEPNSTMKIIDTHGKIIGTYTTLKNTLDISDLAAGIYFLQLEINDEQIIRRFIKN